VIDYGKEVLNLPISQVTEIQALIDEGAFEEARRRLDFFNLVQKALIQVDVDIRTKVHVGAGATGGYRSGLTLVGEKGPELVDMGRGGFIHTAADTRSLMSGSSMGSVGNTTSTPIVVNNYGREFGVADMNHVLAMARLAS